MNMVGILGVLGFALALGLAVVELIRYYSGLKLRVREVHLTGDAMEPGRIHDAISQGYIAEYNI